MSDKNGRKSFRPFKTIYIVNPFPTGG